MTLTPSAADPPGAGQKGQEFRDAIAAKLEKLQEPPPAKQATVRDAPPVPHDCSTQMDSFRSSPWGPFVDRCGPHNPAGSFAQHTPVNDPKRCSCR